MKADEALQKLKDGNWRYVNDKMKERDFKEEREKVLDGQQPYATILTCSDSRVVPHYIFDEGLGNLFEVMNAGNVADKDALGSMEYAAGHLNTPLLVVLGHEKCGAVTAACSGAKVEGNLEETMKKLKKPVEIAKGDVNSAIRENIFHVIDEIRKESPKLAKLETDEKLKIVGAHYSLMTGEVEFF